FLTPIKNPAERNLHIAAQSQMRSPDRRISFPGKCTAPNRRSVKGLRSDLKIEHFLYNIETFREDHAAVDLYLDRSNNQTRFPKTVRSHVCRNNRQDKGM